MTPEQPEETCSSCKYWREYGTQKKGECRRRAPVMLAVSQESRGWDDSVIVLSEAVTSFPEMTSDGWCGEYACREEGRNL